MTVDRSPSLDTSRQSRIAPGLERMADWPWWLIVALLIGLVVLFQIVTNQRMSVIFGAIAAGIGVTVRVTLSAYFLAVIIGLFVGLARVSSNRVILNIASFYVEVVRGVPILVLLMYIAFVIVPLFVTGLNGFGDRLGVETGLGAALAKITTRNISNELRVILGLGIAYGAFESEIFRAGIQSIEKGQIEAARALGMSYVQAMRYVILPQAIRRVLPALGNDFIAMLKDSSLVSILGVEDITQLTKLYAASTFLFFQSYSLLAFIYLTMTLLLSRGVRTLETRLSAHRR
ncbi:MAG: amino acid ABC transporter permease [Chloroflexota bacterium]